MTRQGALALALVLTAPAAGAVSLGEVQVRSFLGEKLDARIPVSPAAGESIRGACFSLSLDGAPGVPRLTGAELTLQRSASGTFLRIRSSAPLHDPALGVGIAIACPGEAPQGTKEFSVLLDPRTRTAAPTGAATRPPLAAGTRLDTREGDTLESIATAIFPRDRAARASYLAALRETNAALAARGDREPIPANESVALPDLRTFMEQRPPRPADSAASSPDAPSSSAELAAGPSAEREAAPPGARAPRRSTPAPSAAEAAKPQPSAAPADRAAAAPPATSRARAIPGFQLKLSAPEVDLTRSSTIDDRSRAQLRERLLMLDADDQVAAMLSLRNSLKQLEARVAELQLKLAGMPPALAAQGEGAPGAKAPAKPEPAAAPPAPVTAAAPKPQAPPAQAEPPKAELPVPAVAPKVELPVPAVASKADPASPEASVPKTEAARPAEPAKPASPRAVPRPPSTASSLPNWLWAVVALLAVFALLLAWYLLRRRRAPEDEYYADEALAADGGPLDEIAPESTPADLEADSEVTFEEAPRERGVVASDAELTTRIPQEDAEDLRRRYIEERFPEITTRMIVLDDADSVVKGARLFYEDGALTRAVELLQFAIEAHPDAVKCWLALFEIFRLERLTGEFAALAHRFKQQHGESEHWHKVQFFGREIDPGNALYQEPMNLETIGPREARRLAAAASFDPIAENWLNAPMDFENEVLANELRMVLMQHAGLAEEDLIPDPMPALRNVEMFTVA